MFKNMKIGMRLSLGFGLVLVLLSVIAFVGITRLAAVNDITDDIVNSKWMKVALLQEGLAGVNEIGIGARDLVLADTADVRQASKERVLKGRAVIGKAWDTLKPTLTQPKHSIHHIHFLYSEDGVHYQISPERLSLEGTFSCNLPLPT